MRSATATAHAFPRSGPTASGAYFPVAIQTSTFGAARLSTRDTTSSVRHLTDAHNGSTYSGIYNPIPLTNETTGSRPTYRWPGPSANMNTRGYESSLQSLQNRAANYGNRQTTCFTFGQPVWDLTVTIGDIDSFWESSTSPSTTRYRDYVAVHARYENSTAPVSGGTVGPRNQVVGSGTTTDPFRRADSFLPSTDDPWSWQTGTVQTTFADGPITEVCVDYWSGEGGGLQVILTSFDFEYCPPPHVPGAHDPRAAAPAPLRRGTWWKALLAGAGLWALTIIVTIATQNVHLVPTLILLGSFLVPFAVGLIEEFVKAVILLTAARAVTLRTPAIGAFLGATVGAGFAAFESAGYAFNSAIAAGQVNLFALLQTELLRGALAPVGHILWTALIGAALFSALGRRQHAAQTARPRTPWGRVALTFLGVAALHGTWDTAGGLAALIAYIVTGAAAQAQQTGGFLPASAEPVIALTTMAIYIGFVAVLSAIGITWLVLALRRGRRSSRPVPVVPEAVSPTAIDRRF